LTLTTADIRRCRYYRTRLWWSKSCLGAVACLISIPRSNAAFTLRARIYRVAVVALRSIRSLRTRSVNAAWFPVLARRKAIRTHAVMYRAHLASLTQSFYGAVLSGGEGQGGVKQIPLFTLEWCRLGLSCIYAALTPRWRRCDRWRVSFLYFYIYSAII